MPQFRSTQYVIWKACERWKILPPGIKQDWDQNENWNKCLLLAYREIRDIEEDEKQLQWMKAMMGSRI